MGGTVSAEEKAAPMTELDVVQALASALSMGSDDEAEVWHETGAILEKLDLKAQEDVLNPKLWASERTQILAHIKAFVARKARENARLAVA